MGSTGIISRRSGVVAALLAALLAFAGSAAASASAAPLVWTAEPGAESVSTIDSGTGKAVGGPIEIPVESGIGPRPVSIALTPNGRRAVAAIEGSSALAVIDVPTREVIELSGPTGMGGGQVAISPDGKSAYVTLEGQEAVEAINPEAPGAGKSITVGGEASAVAFNPDGETAYVGVALGEIVTVDTATRGLVGAPIAVGGVPTSIVFAPDGKTAYVTAEGVEGVRVIDTARGEVVKTISTTLEPSGIAVSPDGERLYIATEFPGTIRVAETATDTIVGKAITVPAGVREIAVAPDGKTLWTAGSRVSRITLAGEKVETISGTGETSALVVAPDQSPTAVFTAPSAFAGTPTAFDGGASTDPDGSVASWTWTFGDGGTASGVSPTHTYFASRTYNATLSVEDDEGCGEEEVFTGRTAYCSGSVPASHAVTVNPAPVVSPVVVPSNKFRLGRVLHNRRNGTVRMQVKLPAAGYVFLFGHKVHAVSRKSKGAQTMWLTIHARVELNKRLKKILRAPVRIRITFTPNGGTARTVHRTVTLQRAARHKHRHTQIAHSRR